MKEGFSQQEIERTAGELGLPTNQPFIQCRIARAYGPMWTMRKKISIDVCD